MQLKEDCDTPRCFYGDDDGALTRSLGDAVLHEHMMVVVVLVGKRQGGRAAWSDVHFVLPSRREITINQLQSVDKLKISCVRAVACQETDDFMQRSLFPNNINISNE
jgi:hypothetical protein